MIEWISVDDRLPENGDDIIMCFDDGGVALGTYDPETGDWFWLKNKEDHGDDHNYGHKACTAAFMLY